MRLFRHHAATSSSVLAGLDGGAFLIAQAGTIIFFEIRVLPGVVGHVFWLAPLLALVNVGMTYGFGVYGRDHVMAPSRAIARLPLALGFSSVLQIVLLNLVVAPVALPPDPYFDSVARTLTLVFFANTMCFVGGVASRGVFVLLMRRGVFQRHVLIIGTGERAAHMSSLFRRNFGESPVTLSFLPVSALGGHGREPVERVAATPAAAALLRDGKAIVDIARALNVDEIVVATDERRGVSPRHLLACKLAGFPVKDFLTMLEHETRRVDLDWMQLSWLVYSDGFRARALDHGLKRGLDILFGICGILLTLPLVLVVAIAIKLESPGPVLFRQERVTQGGRTFRLFKLRSMCADSEKNGPQWAAVRDSRITRVGGFIRRTRIDELPQLINILIGDMSLVGPRPERPMFVDELGAQIPLYHERHAMKAGLTGWAQVNYPYGASVEDAREKLAYDLYYVKNFNIVMDLLIILQTIRVVLWPQGVR